MLRSAVVMKPSTLVNRHTVLTKRKYQQLFSPRSGHRPGPKGPTQELIDAVVAMKRRNPTWGCPRIAEQIALAFAVEVDKDVVRRILSTHYRPDSDAQGPSVRPSVRTSVLAHLPRPHEGRVIPLEHVRINRNTLTFASVDASVFVYAN